MKIKRTAWHYKISRLGTDYEKANDNLCRYFWRPIWKFAIALGLVSYFGFVSYWVVTEPLALIVLLFFASSTVLSVLAIWFMRKKLGKSPKIPYGNIAAEYLKAKKEGICPLIEYID